jgi:predicted O-methyltransferase YrrM
VRGAVLLPGVVTIASIAAGACSGEPAAAARSQPVDPAALRAQEERFDRDRRPDLVVAALALRPGAVVADVGAGTGLMTLHLARAVGDGGRVVATDIDGAVLDMLGTRIDAAGLGGRIERRVVAPDQPGLEAGGYDAILLAQVDNYLADRVTWLRAALPALRPGGRLVITNRLHHRAAALEAAARAGLHRLSESTDAPGQFIAVFTAGTAGTTTPGTPPSPAETTP